MSTEETLNDYAAWLKEEQRKAREKQELSGIDQAKLQNRPLNELTKLKTENDKLRKQNLELLEKVDDYRKFIKAIKIQQAVEDWLNDDSEEE